MRKTLVLVAVVLVFLVAAGAAWAAMDIFLKVEGAKSGVIEGESADDKHKNEIDVLSWTWGVTNSSSASSGGGATAGRVDFQALTITKKMDKSSPKLFQATATGEFLKQAVLTFVKAGGDHFRFLEMKMEGGFVTSYSVDAQISEDLPLEKITFDFAKVTMTYTVQKADGSSGGNVVAAWELLQTKQ